MKLEEARKLGTGPLTYNKKERVLLTSSHAALLAHYYNHFEALVDALEKTQALYASLVMRQKITSIHSKSGIYEDELDSRSDANVKLLAIVKEVEV